MTAALELAPAYEATVAEFAGLDPAPDRPPARPVSALPRRRPLVDLAATTQILPAVPEEVPAP